MGHTNQPRWPAVLAVAVPAGLMRGALIIGVVTSVLLVRRRGSSGAA